jgi:hypothetical protein
VLAPRHARYFCLVLVSEAGSCVAIRLIGCLASATKACSLDWGNKLWICSQESVLASLRTNHVRIHQVRYFTLRPKISTSSPDSQALHERDWLQCCSVNDRSPAVSSHWASPLLSGITPEFVAVGRRTNQLGSLARLQHRKSACLV